MPANHAGHRLTVPSNLAASSCHHSTTQHRRHPLLSTPIASPSINHHRATVSSFSPVLEVASLPLMAVTNPSFSGIESPYPSPPP
ncbi:hypothetical protein COCNU_scaffold018360G000010 [Cocos nucifera]|nr:hypothetical protein [Cocos nucifera]